MRNISENDRRIWTSDIAHKDFKITIGSGEDVKIFLNSGIKEESIEISEVWEDETQLTFTGCHAKKCKVTLEYVGDDLIGKEITVEAKASAMGNETEEILLFSGTISSVTQQGNDDIVSTITAYDAMADAIKMDVAEWYNALTFPMTVQAFADSLATHLADRHIALNSASLPLGETVINETIAPQNLALKDVLNAISTLNGMYCYCAYDNTINFKALTKLEHGGLWPEEDLFPSDDLYPMESWNNAADTISDGALKDITYQNYDVKTIDKVVCREDSDAIGAIYGTGSNAYIIEGNFLLFGKNAEQMAVVAESVYQLVQGITYTPAKITSVAMPWLECGDLICVYSDKNVIYTYILEKTFKGLQITSDTYTSRQNAGRNEQVTGINTSIIQLRGKANKLVRDIDSLSSEIYAYDPETGQKYSRITQNASAIEAKVSIGEISSKLSLESGQITLDTGRLIINSGNFQIDAEGNIKATNAELSGKIEATSGTIAGMTIEERKLRFGNSVGDYFTLKSNFADDNIIMRVGTPADVAPARYTEFLYDGTISTSGLNVKNPLGQAVVSLTNNGRIVGDTVEGKYIYLNGRSIQRTYGQIDTKWDANLGAYVLTGPATLGGYFLYVN